MCVLGRSCFFQAHFSAKAGHLEVALSREGVLLHGARTRCALQSHPQAGCISEESLRKVAAEGKGRDVHVARRLKPSRKEEPHNVFLHSSKQPVS